MNDDFVNVSMYLKDNAQEASLPTGRGLFSGPRCGRKDDLRAPDLQQLDRESDCLAHGFQEAGIVQAHGPSSWSGPVRSGLP